MKRDQIIRLLRRWSPILNFYSDGEEVALNCPFHEGDQKRHLWLNLSKQVFQCFRCSAHGTLANLLYQVRRKVPDRISVEDLRALVFDRPVVESKPVVKSPALALDWPEHFRPLWEGNRDSTLCKQALKYLHGRGVDDNTIELYRIGYVPFGFYRYRVVIPIIENEEVVYWVARDFSGQAEKKILNPPSDKTGHKAKDYVFGLNFALRMGHGTLCEGAFDGMAAGAGGCALLGKTISDTQLDKLCFLPSLTILLDADARGWAGMVMKRFITRPKRPEMSIKLFKLFSKGDPSSHRKNLDMLPTVVVKSLEDLFLATVHA